MMSEREPRRIEALAEIEDRRLTAESGGKGRKLTATLVRKTINGKPAPKYRRYDNPDLTSKWPRSATVWTSRPLQKANPWTTS